MPRSENLFLSEIEALLNRLMGEGLGTAALQKIMEIHGGTRMYIPLATEVFKQRRNESIIQRFNGANHDELAAEFGLCSAHIRKILKEG